MGLGASALSHVLLGALTLLVAFPLYWLLLTSLRDAAEIYSGVPFPVRPTLENFAEALTAIPIIRLFFNTFLMAGLRTLFQLITALLAGFAFVRWEFRGKYLLFSLFVFTWLVPQQVTMIPNYVLLSQLGWLNTQLALVVPHVVSPFAVFLLFQNIRGFPKAIIDSAKIDGARDWTLLWRIIVPNLTAILSALTILLFVGAWNDYFWPVLVMRRMENSVMQVGLQAFLTQEGNAWGPLMAAACISIAPILAFYFAFRSRVVDAFVRSGLH